MRNGSLGDYPRSRRKWRTTIIESGNIGAMKFSVHYLLPVFLLMLVLTSQFGAAMQFDNYPLFLDEISDARVATLDNNDDPETLLPVLSAPPESYAYQKSLCATQHGIITQNAAAPCARAPPLV